MRGGAGRALYADDALLQVSTTTIHRADLAASSRAQAQAIAAYYDDLCGRAMSHHVDLGRCQRRGAFFHPDVHGSDGAKVFCAAMLELKGGKIARQTVVQAWDS